MKIQNSSINMSGNPGTFESHSKTESLKVWFGSRKPDFNFNKSASSKPSKLQLDILELSEEARKSLETKKQSELQAVGAEDKSEFDLSEIDKRKIQLLQEFIEKLTGKKFKIYLMKDLDLNIPITNMKIEMPKKATKQLQPSGFGAEFNYHEFNYESQKMSFSSDGVIKTADGREIDFSVQLNMSREFLSQTDISARAGDARRIDPLVINFDGNPPGLTETKFNFDIDSDGTPDQISFAASGSGFLALDSNGDGIINNGKELFGPQSGNGFSELAMYDTDNNNWIDENDAIYDKLRIWTKDSEGNDQLFALGQKGIGAIYLGNVDTSYSLKNENNDSLGEIRKSGIFVRENGTVGTMQHIDLTL